MKEDQSMTNDQAGTDETPAPAAAHPTPPAPSNIIQAIARVMAELPGVGKNQTMSSSSGGYSYRGIEDITAAIQHLMGKYVVVPVPRVMERSVAEISLGNKPWTEDTMKVMYTLYGPGGKADFVEAGPFIGVARDNADKGTNKCQPPGTLVRVPVQDNFGRRGRGMAWYREVPIETIREGDRVVTWDRRTGWMKPLGRTVTGVASRPYEGPMVAVDVDGATSSYTPNHHCYVRLPDALTEGDQIVYLMRRGDRYRVGRCRWRADQQANGKRGRIGLAWRMWAEDAEAAWVLSAHDSVAGAAMAEVLASVRFGIPQTSFTGNTDTERGRRTSAFDPETFWSKVGDNREQATGCLAHHGRLIDRPLIERTGPRTQVGTLPTIKTAAANLMSGMLLPKPGHPTAATWHPAQVGRTFHAGLVHSLEVAVDHNYVADGLITGNCMTQVFKQMLLQVFVVGDNRDDPDSYASQDRDVHREPTPDEWAAQQGWESALDRENAKQSARSALSARAEAGDITRERAAELFREYQRPDGEEPAKPRLRSRAEHLAWWAKHSGQVNEHEDNPLDPPNAYGNATAALAAAVAPPEPPQAAQEPPEPEAGTTAPEVPVGPPEGNGQRDGLNELAKAAFAKDGSETRLIEEIQQMPVSEVAERLALRGLANPPGTGSVLRRRLAEAVVREHHEDNPAADKAR